MYDKLKEEMRSVSELVNERIGLVFNKSDNAKLDILTESMKYSVFAGGKRIRPFLVIEFCELFNGNIEEALVYAVAIELIHTYSLIHDDLPCMDNDDFRRGQPTNHKIYGEATALLAGDAMLTLAFNLISDSDIITSDHKVKAISILSKSSGYLGMIGGQQLDLSNDVSNTSYEEMIHTHELKTCELIIASCRLGLLAASVNDVNTVDKCVGYCMGLGRLFQLTDDILDCTSTTEELGKDVGTDVKNGTVTYLSFMPLDIALGLADVILDETKKNIASIDNSQLFKDLADFIRYRKE